jgi:hypothetical protein
MASNPETPGRIQLYKHAYPKTGARLLPVHCSGNDFVPWCIVVIIPSEKDFPPYPAFFPYKLETMCIPSHTVSRTEAIDVMKESLINKVLSAALGKHVREKLDELLAEEAQLRYTKKMAQRIWKHWWDALSNPYNPFGKRRLIREFDDLLTLDSPMK